MRTFRRLPNVRKDERGILDILADRDISAAREWLAWEYSDKFVRGFTDKEVMEFSGCLAGEQFTAALIKLSEACRNAADAGYRMGRALNLLRWLMTRKESA